MGAHGHSGLGDAWVCVGPILDGGGGPSSCFAPTSVSGPLVPARFCAARGKGAAMASQLRGKRRAQRSKEDAAPAPVRATPHSARSGDIALFLLCIAYHQSIITSSTLVLDRLVIHRLSSLATSRRASCGPVTSRSSQLLRYGRVAMACHADDGWRRLLARRRRRRQFLFGNSAFRQT